MFNTQPKPSFHSGYAHYGGESDEPDLWPDRVISWVPVLGHQGDLLHSQSDTLARLTNTGLEYVTTEAGIALGNAASNVQFASGVSDLLVNFTEECLFVPSSTGTQPVVGHADGVGGGTHDRDLYVVASNVFRFYTFDGVAKTVDSVTQPVIGEPIHIVVTADGSFIRMYINGVLENSTASGNAFTGYVDPLFVFSMGFDGISVNASGDGSILFFNVYDRALTAPEILMRSKDALGFVRLKEPGESFYAKALKQVARNDFYKRSS